MRMHERFLRCSLVALLALAVPAAAQAGERVVFSERSGDLYLTSSDALSTKRPLATNAYDGALSANGLSLVYSNQPYCVPATRISVLDVDGSATTTPYESPLVAGSYRGATSSVSRRRTRSITRRTGRT
jgi:hypothetical protein